LRTGFDNSDFTFSGRFGSATQASTSFNLDKIGTGTMTIDSAAGTYTVSIGVATVSQGTLVLSGANGSTKFGTYTLPTGGALVLDNTVNNLNNRLGGVDMAAANRALNLNGGVLTILGNAGAPTVEGINSGTTGTMTLGSGGSVLTLAPNAAQPLGFTIGTLAAPATSATMLVRGTNLGSAQGAGVASFIAGGPLATVFPPTFSALNLTGGGAYDGSNLISIRADIVADTSSTGLGSGFATYSVGTGLRPITSAELAPGLFRALSTTSNVGIGGSGLFGTATVNSLTFTAPSTLTGALNPNVLTITSGGLLVKSGTHGVQRPERRDRSPLEERSSSSINSTLQTCSISGRICKPQPVW
jgi:hypothetical protein